MAIKLERKKDSVLLGDTESFDLRVLTVSKEANNQIVFTERCDEYFSATATKEEAIKILEDIISFIKE